MKETITEADCKMSVYIWNILRSQIQILWSWGFSDVRTIKNGIRFHVQGFKLNGTVEIRLNEGSDLFDVSFLEDSGNLKKAVNGIYIDSLVSTIDNEVEYTGEDYAEKVEESLKVEF